jgi:hypothetical protein
LLEAGLFLYGPAKPVNEVTQSEPEFTAASQLLCPETTVANWLFAQEKAASHGAGKDTLIVELL